MLSNYHSVLQVGSQISGNRLERAWRTCRARFTRLTARGPLRFYRHDLLKQADFAYQSLRGTPPTEDSSASLLTRRLRQEGKTIAPSRAPVKSTIRSGTILANPPESLAARKLENVRNTAPKRIQAKIEDDFCLEVLYRLEGDLLRFSCRRELLKLAEKAKIHPFRANMLMAQIVESVRQHKLYEPSREEIQGESEKKGEIHKYRGGKPRALVITAAFLCIFIDIFIVLLLMLR